MKDWTGVVTVVTGAGSGMGRSYAVEAARRGAVLVLGDVDEVGLAGTVELLPAGTRVLATPYDVGDRDATFAVARRVEAELGPARVLVNNAGVEGSVQPLWASDDAHLERVLRVNLWGVVHGTRAFLPQLLTHERAAIVNVSSLFGLVGTPNHTDYCTSKFAVRGFSEALGAELLHTGVRVHTVHPGGVATNIVRAEAGQAYSRHYLTTSPDEVARVVLDAVGTRRTRIVVGNRAGSTALGARLLPAWAMTRLVWRDLSRVVDLSHYPPTPGSTR